MSPPRLSFVVGAMFAGFVWSSPSWAECKTAYTGEELVADLSTMTTSLRSLDEEAFKTAGASLEGRLACIKTPVPTPVFASAYRYIGTYHYFSGNEPAARRWYRSGLELDPSFDWDVSELDVGHPLRAIFDQERDGALSEPKLHEGKRLNQPAGSTLYLDGRPLSVPEAREDRPHILQVIGDSDRSVRQVFVIEGAEFPSQFLGEEQATAAVVEPGKKNKKKDAKSEQATSGEEYDVVKIDRVRPAAKTPLMVTGALVTIGGGVLYGLTFASHNKFEQASTTDDLERYRSLTNTMVIASGATVAVGVSVGYAGILMNGTPGLRFGGRF